MPAGRKETSASRTVLSGRKTVSRKPRDEALFMTEVSNVRKDSVLSSLSSPDIDFDKDDDEKEEPRQKLGADEIKLQLYRRECRQLDVTPVGAYLRSPSSPVLTIKHYSLGPLGARALAVPLMLDSCIVCLDLEGNDLGGEGAKNLMEALTESCSITDLNLSNNSLGSAGAGVMERILMHNNLIHSLTLSGSHFKDADAAHFARVLTERKILKTLNLSHNEFGDSAAAILGQALATNDTLESFDISWNHIRPKGGKAFMGGIKENVGLKKLSVANNGLGDEGCGAAAMALSSNSSLLEMDMSGNRITNTGFLAIASCIKSNETLQVLKLGNNLATGLGAQTLGETILQSEACAVRNLDLTNISVWTSLIDLLRAHAQSHPLNLVHGAVTRREIPRDQLEQTIKEDIISTFRTRESEQNVFTDEMIEPKADQALETLANEWGESSLKSSHSRAEANVDVVSEKDVTDDLNAEIDVAADDRAHMSKDQESPGVAGDIGGGVNDVPLDKDTVETDLYLEGQNDTIVISDTDAPPDDDGGNTRKSADNPDELLEEFEDDKQKGQGEVNSIDDAAS